MEAFFQEENTLKKFLGKNESICREERQYALFLYLIFLKKKREETVEENEKYYDKIVKQCLLDSYHKSAERVDIVDVYYEATLMRDYWEYFNQNSEEKGEFTKKVLHFCLDFQLGVGESKKVIDELLKNNPNLINKYLGQKGWLDAISNTYSEVNELLKKVNLADQEKQRVKIKAGLDIARMMMNATPDILVVYRLDGEDRLYAKALECKYLSDEGPYKDVAGVNNKMQLFIQRCIMAFCFGSKKEYCADDIPKFPQRAGVWKEKDELWKETCEKVYKEILTQSQNETNTIENCGVELVRFTDKDEIENKKEIPINLKELLEKMY